MCADHLRKHEVADHPQEDSVVRALLEACGPVTSWKRMQDSDGRPKGFGFCEFKARVFSSASAHPAG